MNLIRLRLAAMLAALAFATATSGILRAEKKAKKLSVGDRVVQKHPDFKVRTDPKQTERSVPIDIWRVEKIDGARVLLSGECLGIVGWAEADRVDHCDRAIRCFSDQLREHPDDTFARVMRAELWLGRAETDEAMADCDEAIRIRKRKRSALGSNFTRTKSRSTMSPSAEARERRLRQTIATIAVSCCLEVPAALAHSIRQPDRIMSEQKSVFRGAPRPVLAPLIN